MDSGWLEIAIRFFLLAGFNFPDMFYVYVLVSETRNYIYVGMTDDIERRINYHNLGYNKTTKAYRPFYLLMTEEHPTRALARAREKYFKSGVGKEYIKAILSKRS
jgi:putative endonuclease